MNEQKVVLVTGAAGAVGGVVAGSLAKGSYRMVVTSRDLRKLNTLAYSLGLPEERLMAHAADLTEPDQVEALMNAVQSRWRGVDILINIAGGWQGGERVADMDVEEWMQAVNMNLHSAFLVNRAVLPHMMDKGWGRIINFGSRAAVKPGQRQAGYNVSKAGVVSLTSSVALEYRLKGITANAVLPSIVDTPANRKAMPDSDFSRWVKPEQIASLALFLCSEEAADINGAAIPVYGKV